MVQRRGTDDGRKSRSNRLAGKVETLCPHERLAVTRVDGTSAPWEIGASRTNLLRLRESQLGRTASIGLLAVLVVLTAFGLSTSIATEQAGQQERSAALRADAYTEVQHALDMETSAHYEFWAEHNRTVEPEFWAAARLFQRALDNAGRSGNAAGMDGVQRYNAIGVLQRQQARYVAASMHFFASTGRSAERKRRDLEQRLLDPLYITMKGETSKAAYSVRTQALDDLQSLRERQTLARNASLVVFPVGLILVGVFWSLRLRSMRAEETRRAEVLRWEQAALTDAVTSLGNHRAFQEELQREIARSSRHGHPLALALVDLDDFKRINDVHGHAHGDRVLARLARVLQRSRAEDRAYRLGGDEFALLLPHTTSTTASIVLERLRQEVSRTLSDATISVGVCDLGGQDLDAETFREEADAALYEAKRRGRNVVVCFHDIRHEVSITSTAEMGSVRRLLEDRNVGVAFQPIWDFESNAIIAYEALMRPACRYHLNGPLQAFEIAEKLGKVHLLDAICREATLARAGELPDDILLFINVAPQTLDHNMLAGNSLAELVEAAGLTPGRVVLEITERGTPKLPMVIKEARRLRDLGFKIALDDVGAGNAGLEVLRQLPVDFVKIDRSVVCAALDDQSARAVMAGIVAFSRQAGAFVIAEGIEDAAMLEFTRHLFDPVALLKSGICGGQGYFLGRPSDRITQKAETEIPGRSEPDQPVQAVDSGLVHFGNYQSRRDRMITG